MTRLTNLGIILLVIGLSFFAGTVYRSTLPYSFQQGIMGPLPLRSHTWKPYVANFLSPRDFRIEVKNNATIDLYMLDAEGMKRWAEDGTLKPVWSIKAVTQEIFTLQISRRDEYGFLVYNPTDSSAAYEINCTLYGFERDLLWTSIAFTITGLVLAVASVLMSRKLRKNK
jgi:hypothetical protein